MWNDDRELRQAKDDADYCRRQYEDEVAQRERAAEQAQRAREERQREIMAAYDETMRTADDWPEALEKQQHLFAREAHLEDDSDPNDDHPFSTGAEACKQALELWRKAEAEVKPQIDALQAQIDALHESVRATVAHQLDVINTTKGAQWVIAALRDPDMRPWKWLDW